VGEKITKENIYKFNYIYLKRNKNLCSKKTKTKQKNPILTRLKRHTMHWGKCLQFWYLPFPYKALSVY
jgi:hypothetical protein